MNEHLYKQRSNERKKIPARLILTVSLFAVWLIAASIMARTSSAVQAAPAAQAPIFTPTPLPDGRIIYIVKANDTLLSISLLTGVPVDTIKGLNNLTSDTIFEGQELLLGLAGPPEVTITPGPTPTETPILPTPTLKPGIGDICVLLFNDVNGDSIRQEEEGSIPGGAISISNRAGSISESVTTGIGLEPTCFENLPEGDYTVSAASPEGYNATTNNSHQIELKAGTELYLNFGAQANSETQAEDQVLPEPGNRSPLLGIIGGLFLLAGVGVAILAGRLIRSR